MDRFVGRQNECGRLEDFLESDRSEFVAVYGRRRVGKTYMIRHVLGKRVAFQMTGVEKATTSEQLHNFWLTMRQLKNDVPLCTTWLDAFDQLERYLERFPDAKKIVFIDELPWMDTRNSDFIKALGWFWNAWASARVDVKLIVCGSATSWMLDHLINDHGGLYNRVTHQIYVPPFVLQECKQFFDSRGYGYSERDVAEAYMIFGGIPYYLSLMQRGYSVAQNVDRLLVSPNGELRGEMDKLFYSLFLHANDYVRIIEALSHKSKGLTRSEIIAATSFHNNARLTQMLYELEKCNFIRCYEPYDGKKRMLCYQLNDPFVHFYYHMVRKNPLQTEHVWERAVGTPMYNAWSGLAFEMLCLNHIPQIQLALGISGMVVKTYSWRTPKAVEQGAQIDLVIDRADKCVNLCEMKFSNSEYEITEDDKQCLEHRIDCFRQYAEPKKSLLLTMITNIGLKTNMYSYLAQCRVTLHDLFAPLR